MNYYALGNVVYKETGEVLCVIAPVWMLNSVASKAASWIASSLTAYEMDERDVLRGSLD